MNALDRVRDLLYHRSERVPTEADAEALRRVLAVAEAAGEYRDQMMPWEECAAGRKLGGAVRAMMEDDGAGDGQAVPVYIEVSAGVRYWEDATVTGVRDDAGTMIPCRRGDRWCPVIRLSDGMVMDWPAGTAADMHYKVCADGEYWLLDGTRKRVGRWRDAYVPDDFLCQGAVGFGDYIVMRIGADGRVRNWRPPTVNPEEWGPVARENGP